MAKVEKNIITSGLSGQLGDQVVFRQLYGQTVVSTKGTPTGDPSEQQAAQREAFKAAVEWAKSTKTNPVYIAASKANRKKFPSGYHAALHDALTPPELTLTSLYRNGALAHGDSKVYTDGVDTSAVVEFSCKGLSLAKLSLQIGIASNQPSANVGAVALVHGLADVNPSYVSLGPSPNGSDKESWQLDLHGVLQDFKTNQGWSLTTDNYVVISVVSAADNYGNSFELDPVNDDPAQLAAYANTLAALEFKLG